MRTKIWTEIWIGPWRQKDNEGQSDMVFFFQAKLLHYFFRLFFFLLKWIFNILFCCRGLDFREILNYSLFSFHFLRPLLIWFGLRFKSSLKISTFFIFTFLNSPCLNISLRIGKKQNKTLIFLIKILTILSFLILFFQLIKVASNLVYLYKHLKKYFGSVLKP